MNRFFKKLLIIFGSVTAITLLVVSLINLHIDLKSKPYIFSDISKVPKVQAALVLGAKVYQYRIISPMLKDRTTTALNLYRDGKVKKILVSGEHRREDYDEVNTVKDYLLENGVKKEDIFLDHAGFDTYDSLYRAKEIFKVQSVTVVTQNFHLPRAIYIGRSLGLDVYGISADRQSYINMERNIAREILAKIKAFWDINLYSKPRFLGTPIPIDGDALKSWD